MEQRLAALFASVGNALDSNTYTYSDSDYLVRKILVKFLEDENALVASARHIPDPEQVVESILNYVISTEFANDDPASWYRKAMAITVEFADFAHRNDMSEDSARYAALLPDGHPRVKRVLPITASAARESLAEWMAADPRLDAEAAEQVRKLYSLDDSADDVEAEFETLKAEALVAAGRMPEDLLPIVAAFNLSFAQRSAISKALAAVRRRDRRGRFAKEFGRLKLFFKSRGQFFSSSPRIVGPGRGENTYQVESKGDPNIPDGIYEVDAALGENVKAYLPKSAVRGLSSRKEVVAEDDKRFAIELDDFLKTKQDTPNNWTKSGNKFVTKDGKFTATKIDSDEAQNFLNKAKERGDDTIISGTGAADAFDPENPESFLVTDNKGRTKGVAQDWSGIQEIAIANGAEFGESGRGAPPTGPEDRGIPAPTDVSGKPTPPDTPGRVKPEPLGRPPRFPGDKGVPEPTDVSGLPRPPRLGERVVSEENEPDLDQDSTAPLDKSKLSPDLLAEGYMFSKDGDKSWTYIGDEESYSVTEGQDGKWYIEKTTWSLGGPPGVSDRTRGVGTFDNPQDAFEEAASLAGNDFDDSWVETIMEERGAEPDLGQDQPEIDSRTQIDPSRLSPELREKYQETFDNFDQAIFNNDRQGIADMLSKAALDNDMPDEVYGVLDEARDWVANRDAAVENALYRASREDIENLLEDPEFAGWRDRLESALTELAPFGQDGYDYDLDQDTAPTLSEKQAEPATGKQYAMLKEFLEERNLDPATEQALADALENKNLNKAQASALIGLGRGADFKEGVDPSKPSERMLNSLQGYLSTKDLTPSEINDTLKSLEADSSRDNVEALLNKLRRKKDKPADLNQGTGSLVKVDDDVYSWNDVYNYVDAMKTPNGWEVFYTNPDLNDRGGQTSHSQAFKSEEEALAFAEELIKQNQEGKDYDRAADDLAAAVDLDQDQETKPSLEDAATDKQYGFLESLLNGKKIDDPNLEAAVRTAVQDKNLTKGEVGAFIGALRNLPDRPNVRREPTAKQVASIKRGIIERDFTPEQIKEIEDRLSSGISFEEASEIIDDIKKRPVTAQGMNDLLDSLAKNQDVDTLRYLLDKPEYAEYRTDIKDTLRQIAVDTEDPNLQEFIDGREEPDLNQDQSVADYLDNMSDPANWNNWGSFPEYTSPDGRLSIRAEGDPDGNYLEVNLDGEPLNLDRDTERAVLDAIEQNNFEAGSRGRPVSERERRDTAQLIAETIRESLADAQGGPDLNQDPRVEEYAETISNELYDQLVKSSIGRAPFNRPKDGIYKSKDGMVEVEVVSDGDAGPDGRLVDASYFEIRLNGRDLASGPLGDPEDLSLDIFKAILNMDFDDKISDEPDPDLDYDGLDLDQNQAARAIQTKDLADQISKELNALDRFGEDVISEAYAGFADDKNSGLAADWIGEVRSYANSRSVPLELSNKLNDLADRMDQELIDRFGVGESARFNSDDAIGIDLDNIADEVNTEREMFFESDANKLIDLLSTEDFYGDVKSGGAEIFINKEDDGTYTATVMYDRGSDEFKSEDRDEVVKEAAFAAADYNIDVMPSSYFKGELDELSKEAENAKSPEQALEFADRIDAIAEDLENNRGNLDTAGSLRDYGQRMREMAEKRQAFLESQLPNEPTTPETQEEMASDPDLNPAGYAKSVSDDLFRQFEASERRDPTGISNATDGRPGLESYESADGRVKVKVNFDADSDGDGFVDASSYDVTIDGVNVGGGPLGFSDDVAANIDRLVEDFFSKKD